MRDTRSRLRKLLSQEAVLHGRFVLSSGAESDYYIDARRVTLSGSGAWLVGELISDMLSVNLPDAVAGMTLGADPIVSAVSLVSTRSGRPLDGLLVRKQAKEHGAGRRIEGPLRPGMRAVVVEDTSTTGASALEAVGVLGEAGVRVDGIITIIDREQGASERIRESGLTFDALFTAAELLQPLPEPVAGTEATPVNKVVLYTDGASIDNPGHSGAGWLLLNPEDREVGRGSRYLGHATNNEAEYRALRLGLEAAAQAGASDVQVRMDSQLVVKQMLGQWRVKEPRLRQLQAEARSAAGKFRSVRFEYIPRERNRVTDGLAGRAAASRGRTGA